MKKVAVCAVIMVLCIIATVLLRKPMDNAELNYTEVKVRVVSSETHQKTIRTQSSTSYQTTYEVTVLYNGKEYDLKNVHDSYSYREGKDVTAYLSNGKLYANIEGVRNASPAGIAYSAALLGSFGMFIVTMLMLARTGQKK